MKKLPLGKQVYRTLIEDDFVYVGSVPKWLDQKSFTISDFKASLKIRLSAKSDFPNNQ